MSKSGKTKFKTAVIALNHRGDESAFPLSPGFSTMGSSCHGLTVYEYFFAAALAGVEGANIDIGDPNTGDEFSTPMDPDEVLDRAQMIAEQACDRLEARRVKANQPPGGPDDQQDPPSRPADETGKSHG